MDTQQSDRLHGTVGAWNRGTHADAVDRCVRGGPQRVGSSPAPNRRSGWLAGGTGFWLRFVVYGARLTVLDPLRKLGQNSVERTGDGAAGGDPGERLPRDMAEPTVQ